MTLRKSLLLTGASALLLYPAAAGAQEGYSIGAPFDAAGLSGNETVSIEVGGGYSNGDAFKFGEYSGLEDETFFVIGNVDALWRDDTDDDSAFYLDLSARNLGLESRELEIEAGAQGRYGGRLHYQEIPHYLIEDARTPYRGAGTDNLSLPPPDPLAPPATTPADIVSAYSLQDIDIENDRQRIGASLFWLPLENWRFDVDYRNEVREGTKTTYGIFGVNGGDPASVALPEPIDYETDEVDATAGYVGERFQLQASYNASLFTNRNRSLTWDNAYTAPPGGNWTGTGEDTPDEGQMSLDPDNQAHNLTLSGGYDITPTTRVTASVGYGMMLQDDDFLPYTINVDLLPVTPPSDKSLDGEVRTLRADVGVSARPIQQLDLSARYRFHDRDNNTDQNRYFVTPNDTRAQDPNNPSEPGLTRRNLPHSYTQHVANLDAGFRVVPSTKVSLNYEFERMERTFAERDHTNEHTVGAKVRSQPLDMLSGWVAYNFGTRDGDKYIGNEPYQESHPVEPDPNAFENPDDVRKYHLADRDRNEAKGAVTVTPLDNLAVTLSGSYVFDDYDETDLGLTESEWVSTTLDVSYSPMAGLTAYGFYTFDQLTYDQDGIQWQGFAPSQLNDPGRLWSTESEDRVHTVGVGATWAAIPDRLDISADLVLSWAKTEYDIKFGSTLSDSQLPDLETDFRSLQIAADYQVMENVSLRVGYRYEFFDTKDFALDGIEPGTVDRAVVFGEDAPDYTAHVIGVSTRIAF